MRGILGELREWERSVGSNEDTVRGAREWETGKAMRKGGNSNGRERTRLRRWKMGMRLRVKGKVKR